MNAQGPGEEEITALLFQVQVAALQWEALGYFWGTHPQAVLSNMLHRDKLFPGAGFLPRKGWLFFISARCSWNKHTGEMRGACSSHKNVAQQPRIHFDAEWVREGKRIMFMN